MELMIMHEGLQQSYTELATVNFGDLADQVSKAPEDYVFILSTKECREWVKLHQGMLSSLRALKSDQERWKRMAQFAKEHHTNPTSLISIISLYPSIGTSHKITVLTEDVLKDCCAVFFAGAGQEMKRSEEVIRDVVIFRAEQVRKLPSS